MNSTPDEPTELLPADELLLAAHDQARAALSEITPAATIGDPAGYTVEEGGVVSLRFENRLSGYPGWFWTVSLARVADADPTVLEVELLPGGDALLAPDWVPWAVRLADYQAAQQAIAEANAAAGIVDEGDTDDLDADDLEVDDLDDELDGDELSDLDDLDAADFDSDGSPILHAGDLDGVDIDELDDSGDDDSDEDEEDDDSDEDEDDSGEV